jgi:hypothetical protein
MENKHQNAATHNTAAFFSFANHPLKLRLYLLKNLPAAFFSGVKVVTATEEACTVSVPYRRFTQNPFRSTYFACLSMAAELSTGLLAMANIYGRRPSVSMLITGMEARFHKKAKGPSFFTCTNGALIRDAIDTTVRSGEGLEIKVYSVGKNNVGEVVAEFWFSWSFKRK